jgi:hypothetical protein
MDHDIGGNTGSGIEQNSEWHKAGFLLEVATQMALNDCTQGTHSIPHGFVDATFARPDAFFTGPFTANKLHSESLLKSERTNVRGVVNRLCLPQLTWQIHCCAVSE